MKKIIEKWKSVDAEMKATRKVFLPGYFNKNIFRGIFAFIGALVLINVFMFMQNPEFVGIECKSLGGCYNPYYICTPEDLEYNYNAKFMQEKISCIEQAPWFLSNITILQMKMFEQGFKYGRTDFLAKNSETMVWYLVILAFIINSIYYRLKFKTWKYNKDNHYEGTRENNKGSKRCGNEQPTNSVLYEGDKKE